MKPGHGRNGFEEIKHEVQQAAPKSCPQAHQVYFKRREELSSKENDAKSKNTQDMKQKESEEENNMCAPPLPFCT